MVKNVIKHLKAYECLIPIWDDDSYNYKFNYPVISHSISAARYKTWLYLRREDFIDKKYWDFQKNIKVKTIGNVKPELYFGNLDDFKRMTEYRNIPFVYQGMAVDVAGNKGWITGNVGFNLAVMFEGSTNPLSNCHPTWETTFYDQEMNIVKDFKKTK